MNNPIITSNPNPVEVVNPTTTNDTNETTAAITAYGICVMTWTIWSDPDPVLESIVESEIGEQWSPNTPPASTAAIDASNSSGTSNVMIIFPAIGTSIPNDPQDVPVVNAMIHATTNTIAGRNAAEIFESFTI